MKSNFKKFLTSHCPSGIRRRISKYEEFLERWNVYREFLDDLNEMEFRNEYRKFGDESTSFIRFVIACLESSLRESVMIEGRVIYFSDLYAVLRQIEDLYISNQYFFSSDKTKPVILDCGGNIGLSAVYFKKLFPNAEITVFEPDANLFSLIEKNVSENALEGIQLEQCALGDREGIAEFFVSSEYSMAGSLSDRRVRFGDTIEKNHVPIKKLSPFIHGSIDMLKMDIEGGEFVVFEEIKSKLPSIENIVCEVHCSKDEMGMDLLGILKCLTDNGFNYFVDMCEGFRERATQKPLSFIGEDYSTLVYAKRFK